MVWFVLKRAGHSNVCEAAGRGLGDLAKYRGHCELGCQRCRSARLTKGFFFLLFLLRLFFIFFFSSFLLFFFFRKRSPRLTGAERAKAGSWNSCVTKLPSIDRCPQPLLSGWQNLHDVTLSQLRRLVQDFHQPIPHNGVFWIPHPCHAHVLHRDTNDRLHQP